MAIGPLASSRVYHADPDDDGSAKGYVAMRPSDPWCGEFSIPEVDLVHTA
jgi:hypothetical protein